MASEQKATFHQGVALGVAIAAVCVHGLLCMDGDWRSIYVDFKATLPILTRLTISPVWRVGVPVVGVAAIGWLAVRRPPRLAPYFVVALALALAAVSTWYFPSAPLHALADTIK